ncbi:hypothetical protein NQD34_016145 [Periophthalmus magnuspinnatus]|nr:hypothetical protein NQD34_016145 [Periophthalmus magnuspinnatus]
MAGIRRMNGKYSGVNPAVSCCRLRQIQSLLCGETATPDGILCSLGIDSRYNEGCTELAKYLFYGLYGRKQSSLDHTSGDFSEEMLDGILLFLKLFIVILDCILICYVLFSDVILLIKSEGVHLYCNPLNYNYLLPYISHWRNLHLYCMTESEYEDEEAAEEFKISSFVTMVQDCYNIGVPYSSRGHVQKFDMFMVEKWPLIQAFALEGIGGGSFFTLKFKLIDMSEKLWEVYNKLDPVSLEHFLSEDLVTFEKQWSSFFSSMDLESHLSILELSEAQAGESFRTYYSHGLISSNITDKSKNQQPFVLFGRHSSSEDFENYSFNFPSESHQVRNTGPQGSTARQMVLQCVAPKGPLSCSRTYFFGTTHTPFLGKCLFIAVLSQIYAAVVQAVLSGIKCYSSTSSLTKAKDVAENTFLLALDSMNLCQYRTALRSKCEFNIQAVDSDGSLILSITVCSKASMTVHNIPDLQWDRGDMGSVIFSESFLESSINIQQKDGTVSSDSCYTVLTTSVPCYACWQLEADVKQSEEAQNLTKKEGGCLGTALTAADAAYVHSSSNLSTPEEGKIVFFSEGLLFIHSQYGSITISRDHISSIKLYDSDSSSLASLFVEYEKTLLPYLPFPLHSSDQCLVFALQPRSKSHKAFYSKVLPVWQNSDFGLTLQIVDQEQLVWNQTNMHCRLQKLHDSQEPPVAKRRGNMKTSCSQLPELDMFLQHFALSSISHEPILNDHLGALFPSTELRKPVKSQGDKVVITIITGLPGSHKTRLGQFLVNFSKERGRWVVYEDGSDSCDRFSASHLQQFLSGFLESHPGLRGKARLLLLSPGYTDVLDVIQAILFHPDPAAQACFTIGAVTACIDPLASCMEHRFAFPKLLEQCSQGIVSTVVFTSLTAEQKHPLLQHVQQLVRSANPTAAFILAEKGAVTRTEDVNVILSDSSFNEAQMLRARYVLYPGWCKGRFFTGAGSVVLSQRRLVFTRPLERPLFVASCKALKSSLKPSPFHGNVYNISGRMCFSGVNQAFFFGPLDSDQTMEVTYNTVSGTLCVVPASSPQTTSCFLVFDGLGLTEDGLKDWLRLCTKQVDI